MEQLNDYLSLLEKEIKQHDLPVQPANLYAPLSYFFSLGGKRIRPILTLLGAELFGEKKEKALPAALAIEYFHNFSLIHDDIMDNAPLRRKMATVHEKWNTNIAILSGDVLLVKAYQELCKQKPAHLPALMAVFNQTATEVCEGQQMDMDFESQATIKLEEYIEMIRLKTSVLLGGALKIGAIISEADEKNQALLYEFGVNLGIAFQIQDDLLDLFANPETFGKQVGGDVLADKKTILTIKAIELVGMANFHEFKKKQINQSNEAIVINTKNYFNQIGVKNHVLGIRDAYFEKAEQALQQIQVAEDNKKKLQLLVAFLKEREV